MQQINGTDDIIRTKKVLETLTPTPQAARAITRKAGDADEDDEDGKYTIQQVAASLRALQRDGLAQMAPTGWYLTPQN